jgi:hypothetical protein
MNKSNNHVRQAQHELKQNKPLKYRQTATLQIKYSKNIQIFNTQENTHELKPQNTKHLQKKTKSHKNQKLIN